MKALAGALLLLGSLHYGPSLVTETGWDLLVGLVIGFGLLLVTIGMMEER